MTNPKDFDPMYWPKHKVQCRSFTKRKTCSSYVDKIICRLRDKYDRRTTQNTERMREADTAKTWGAGQETCKRTQISYGSSMSGPMSVKHWLYMEVLVNFLLSDVYAQSHHTEQPASPDKAIVK